MIVTGKSQESAPRLWRTAFKSYDEMETGEAQFLIKDVFPYGINFVAGLSDTGKTWFVLSAAKALVSGQPFLGTFDVPAPIPVIYLIPESGERPFRARLEKMRMTTAAERFICRTMHSGAILGLDSPELLQAVHAMKPAVVLDTAIRFSGASDENSAAQNRVLALEMFALITAGARGIIAIHHSPKATAAQSEMTLETALRGTGDLGAMSDAVHALQCVNRDAFELRVQCVKARDFEPVRPFHIQGRPYIDETGDFAITQARSQRGDAEKLANAVADNPSADYRELAEITGISTGRIKGVAAQARLKKEGGRWAGLRSAANAATSIHRYFGGK